MNIIELFCIMHAQKVMLNGYVNNDNFKDQIDVNTKIKMVKLVYIMHAQKVILKWLSY